MSKPTKIDVKREGFGIQLRITKPVSRDDPEFAHVTDVEMLARVIDVEVPIIQGLMLAAGIVAESIPGVQQAFALLARQAKKAVEPEEPIMARIHPAEPMTSDAPPTGAKEAQPAQ